MPRKTQPTRTRTAAVRYTRRYPSRVYGNGAYRRYPRPTYLRGRGAYTLSNGPWARLGSRIGGQVGRMYGGPVGSYLGSALGRRLFHYPARLFGSGSYYTSPNAPVQAPQVPVFAKKGDYVEISHREYIGDIISAGVAGATTIRTFAIQPGESATFPWLSSIAQPNYQQYQFVGCEFEFVSFSSNGLNSTNTALGAVVAGIDYDFTSNGLTNRSQIENLSWSQACKPSQSTMIPVECAGSMTPGRGLLYVLNQAGTPSVNVDLKTYMLGKLYILTTGQPGTNVNLGSLYVTYKIRLYKPMLQAPLSNANIVKLYRSGVTNSNPVGTATVTTQYTCDTLGVSFPNSTTISFRTDRLIPGSRYLLFLQWVGASTANLVNAARTTGFVGFSSGYGWAMSDSGGYDLGTFPLSPVATGITDVSCLAITELSVNETVAQTGAYMSFSTGGNWPSPGSLMVYMIQRNGLDTASIGYYDGY